MIYLSSFTFPSMSTQDGFIISEKHTCYDTFYPFKVLDAGTLEFGPITILYGNNGSGKTTALNVMAETLRLQRDSKIYDFDVQPPLIKKWTDLENVRTSYNFFKKNENNFK